MQFCNPVARHLLHVNMGIPACYVQTLQFQRSKDVYIPMLFQTDSEKKQPADSD